MTDVDHSYREHLRRFLAREVCPRVDAWERDSTFPANAFRRLGQEGFFRPCLISTASGAQPVLPLEPGPFSILVQELARTRCFGLTLTVCMHVGVFLPLVLRLASPETRTDLADRAIHGELLGTVAITEPDGAGSDFMSIKTTAVIDPGGIQLSGQKHYVTNGAVADYLVVFARHRPERSFTSFGAFLVPARAEGVRRWRIPLDVMRTAVISRVDFDQVRLGHHAILGRKELGMRYFLEHIAVERLAGGIWAVASAEQCLAEAQQAAAIRVVGDRTLWQRSTVRHRIAEAVAQVRLLRALVEATAARTAERGAVDQFDSAILKASVAPMMERVIGLCLQLQGARGFEAGNPLLRLLNDFRVFGVAGGATETMLEVIAEFWAEHSFRSAADEAAACSTGGTG